MFVADKLLAPHTQDFHGIKSALRTWHADATALTQPKMAPDDVKTQPRWLVAEYAFLRFLWRGSQAAYHRGGPGSDHPTHPSFVKLVEQCRRMCLHKYSSVRAAARCATEGVMKRFPTSIPQALRPGRGCARRHTRRRGQVRRRVQAPQGDHLGEPATDGPCVISGPSPRRSSGRRITTARRRKPA